MPDGDSGKRLVKAIQNGAGALIARLMVIIGMPVITGLAAYAVHATLENISLEIRQVSTKIDDVSERSRATEIKVNQLQNDVGRLQEQSLNVNRRLEQIEMRSR